MNYEWKEFKSLPEIKKLSSRAQWVLFNDYNNLSMGGSKRSGCKTTYVECDYVLDDYVE